MKPFIPAVLFLAMLAGITNATRAQYTFTKLVQFTSANGTAAGDRLAFDANGNIFGTTVYGGGWGSIFKIDASTHAFSTLASFNLSSTGGRPWSGLVSDTKGNFYGATEFGGGHGYGTVFEVPAGSSTIVTLASFETSAGSDYLRPTLFANSLGDVFGIMPADAIGHDGTLFKISAGAHTITTLASFNATNGKNPNPGLVADSNGNLYGTTEYGGADNYGAIFKFDTATNTLSTIFSFTKETGILPLIGLSLDSLGNLYGATSEVGPTHNGTIFKLSSDLTTLTVLTPSFGRGVLGSLVCDENGNLFGATHGGDIFEVPAGANAPITLYSSGRLNDTQGGVIGDSEGNIFGTTGYGFPNVFELSPVLEPPSLLLGLCAILSWIGWRRVQLLARPPA